ncbi:SDR family oxidoreductase [Marmoricola sp. RAF53]|uniref:SDR family oxidoreductase n=1 Tax=Marmoricola sp. RAF53 TaxID=3233059 RepID=UPI003F960FFA
MSTLALTGSTGQLGGLVARALADLSPRLIVRDPSRAPDIAGREVAVAEYADHDAAVAALTGVDVLFMVSAAEHPERRAQHRTFIQAAVDAGVGHILYTSFFGAGPDAVFALNRDHHDTEQALAESGIEHTVLRDNFYLDVLPYFADHEGVIRGPAGEGRVSAVARADVAAAAETILRAPEEHVGAVYELTGAEALTMAEIATRTGRVLGRELRFENETDDEAYASRRAAYPDAEQWQLDAWVSTYTAIREGEQERLTDDVRQLTGRRPRSLERVLTA